MKLISNTFFIASLVLGMIACQSETEDFEDTGNSLPDSTSVSTPATPAVATPLPALPPQALPLPQSATGLPNQVGQRPLVNPAHGLPFHDCAIEVGAPLVNKGNIAQPAMPGLTPTLPNLQTNPAGVKLNPAHGQPGHRCEIAVGAPLS